MKQLAAWTVVLALCAWTATGCGEAQRVDPEASEKQFHLGAQLFQQGMLRPALEELLKAVKFNPRNADAWHLLGLLALREAKETEDMIERVACLRGPEAQLTRTDIDGKFREAEKNFRKALETKPDFSDAWNSLAVVAMHFQDWEGAVAATGKALSNPLYREPWAAQGNLGWAYLHQREYARAAKELRQAVFSNPNFCVGRYRLAQLHYEMKNLEGAVEELDRVVADKRCPIQEAYHLLGLVALRAGDRPRAAEAFSQCVALAPKSCLAKECRIGD